MQPYNHCKHYQQKKDNWNSLKLPWEKSQSKGLSQTRKKGWFWSRPALRPQQSRSHQRAIMPNELKNQANKGIQGDTHRASEHLGVPGMLHNVDALPSRTAKPSTFCKAVLQKSAKSSTFLTCSSVTSCRLQFSGPGFRIYNIFQQYTCGKQSHRRSNKS